MHSTHLVFILLLLAWDSAAAPCDGTAGESYDVGIITCPEGDVILVQVNEEGDVNEALENPGDNYPISADNLRSSDHSLGDEVVESATNEGIADAAANLNSDPLVAIQAEADSKAAKAANLNSDPLVAIQAEADSKAAKAANLNSDPLASIKSENHEVSQRNEDADGNVVVNTESVNSQHASSCAPQ